MYTVTLTFSRSVTCPAMANRTGNNASSCLLSPLTGRVYYLDVKPSKRQVQLKANLLKLGANVEDFLSKYVNYLITDRLDGTTCNNNNDPTKNNTDVDSWLPDTPISGVPSPAFSRAFPLDNDIQFPESPVTDSFRAPIPTPVQSRGQALLERSVKHKMQKNGSADILEISRQWGIKILSLGSFLELMNRWLKASSVQKNITAKHNLDQKKSSTCTKPFRIIQLTSPFIKVQDINEEHRPFYRQLEHWPDLHTPSPPNTQLSCYGKNQNTAVFKKTLLRKSSPLKNQENLNGLTSKTNKKHFVQKAMQQKAKLGYCEICGLSYSTLSKHIQTKTHASFMMDEGNFKNLREIVLKLPTAMILMKMKRSLTNVHKQEQKKARSADPLTITPTYDFGPEAISSIKNKPEDDSFVEASCSTINSPCAGYLEGLPFCNNLSSSSEIHVLFETKSYEKITFNCKNAFLEPYRSPECGPPPIAHQSSVTGSNNCTTCADNCTTCADNCTTCADNCIICADNSKTCADNCTTCAGDLEPLNLSLRQSPDQVVTKKATEPDSTIRKGTKRQSEHLFFSENAQISTLGLKDSGTNMAANSTVCFSKNQFESHIKVETNNDSDSGLLNKPPILSPQVCKDETKNGLAVERQAPEVLSVRKVLSFASSPRKAFKASRNSVESTSSSWQREPLSGLSPVGTSQVFLIEKNCSSSDVSTSLYNYDIFNSEKDSKDFYGFKSDYYS